jgi:hypothetical protein
MGHMQTQPHLRLLTWTARVAKIENKTSIIINIINIINFILVKFLCNGTSYSGLVITHNRI